MTDWVEAESESQGPAVEQLVLGVACGRLITALATEKAGAGFLFDITDVTSPFDCQVFPLDSGKSIQECSIGIQCR